MLNRLRAWAGTAVAKARVVVTAWPTWAAFMTGVLTYVATEFVPSLPGPWAVRAGAWLATAGAAVRSVSYVVSIVTPVLYPQNKGLLAPAPEQRPGPLQAFTARRMVRTWGPAGKGPLPPVPPEAYPPGSERLPHSRR